MSPARSLVAAVPQRVWVGVSCLVLLASVGLGTVLDAGLSAWRVAVGTTAAPAPRVVVSPPSSAVVVVPTPLAPVPAAPVALRVGARPASAQRPAAPAPARPAAPPAAAPVAVTPPVAVPQPVVPTADGIPSGQRPRLVGVTATHDRGRHLGLILGRRGAPAASHGHHGHHGHPAHPAGHGHRHGHGHGQGRG